MARNYPPKHTRHFLSSHFFGFQRCLLILVIFSTPNINYYSSFLNLLYVFGKHRERERGLQFPILISGRPKIAHSSERLTDFWLGLVLSVEVVIGLK